MRKALISGLVLALLGGAAIALAQTGQGGAGVGRCSRVGRGWGYDQAKAETVTGTVSAVEEFGRGRRMGPGLGLRVATTSGQVLAHLGPKGYFDGKDVSFAVGETVELKGVKTLRRGQETFLVEEVTRGNETFRLRDDTGRPLWAGWRRQAAQQ